MNCFILTCVLTDQASAIRPAMSGSPAAAVPAPPPSYNPAYNPAPPPPYHHAHDDMVYGKPPPPPNHSDNHSVMVYGKPPPPPPPMLPHMRKLVEIGFSTQEILKVLARLPANYTFDQALEAMLAPTPQNDFEQFYRDLGLTVEDMATIKELAEMFEVSVEEAAQAFLADEKNSDEASKTLMAAASHNPKPL